MDPVPIAIYGGVIPATILALLMLASALATRPRKPGATGGSPAHAIPARLAIPTVAWLAGFLVAIACIHLTNVTSWNRPDLWPRNADQRFLHSAAILSLWALVELALGAAGRPGASAPARPARIPACLIAVRWIGRALALAAVLFLLAHAYVHTIGWTMLVALVAAGTPLALVSTLAMAAARGRHPALPWATQLLAALGAAGVLFIGGTATASQSAAGLAAIAAATAAALLIARRAAPGPAAAFLWSACLAWLLMVGSVATTETNFASCALILAAPWGWLLPRRLDLDLFWKRVPLTLIAAIAWAILCTGAAVALAAITQSPPPEPYSF